MNEGLTEAQRAAILTVLSRFPEIESAVLFGSRALGTWSGASDVDLALYGGSLSLEVEARIAAALEDLGFPIEIDLVRAERIESEQLRTHIADFGIPLLLRDRVKMPSDGKFP